MVNQENNEIISAVNMMERLLPRLKEDSRETIKRAHLGQIKVNIMMILKLLNNNGCNNLMLLTPLMEVANLIETLMKDDNFIETDEDTKYLIVDRMRPAMVEMYIFAGKFYMEHHFEFVPTQMSILINIVEACINNGFYFGYDEKLKAEGLI